jgi:hypothetical protein
VVTLLHDGKFDEAEEALTTFSHNGVLSCENEVFYRFLLEAAIRRSKSEPMKETARLRKPALLKQKV